MKACREKPSFVFPNGTILEDPNAVMKILQFKENHSGHGYKVEVLKWKLEPPDEVKKYLDMNNFWILVNAESIPNIQVLQ
jgi:hypothetical protein